MCDINFYFKQNLCEFKSNLYSQLILKIYENFMGLTFKKFMKISPSMQSLSTYGCRGVASTTKFFKIGRVFWEKIPNPLNFSAPYKKNETPLEKYWLRPCMDVKIKDMSSNKRENYLHALRSISHYSFYMLNVNEFAIIPIGNSAL